MRGLLFSTHTAICHLQETQNPRDSRLAALQTSEDVLIKAIYASFSVFTNHAERNLTDLLFNYLRQYTLNTKR